MPLYPSTNREISFRRSSLILVFAPNTGDLSVEHINNVSISASTTSGDIEIGEEEFTGSVNRVLGTSNATLKLNTTSGDIEVN